MAGTLMQDETSSFLFDVSSIDGKIKSISSKPGAVYIHEVFLLMHLLSTSSLSLVSLPKSVVISHLQSLT